MPRHLTASHRVRKDHVADVGAKKKKAGQRLARRLFSTAAGEMMDYDSGPHTTTYQAAVKQQ
jgi:hypothetical protein